MQFRNRSEGLLAEQQ